MRNRLGDNNNMSSSSNTTNNIINSIHIASNSIHSSDVDDIASNITPNHMNNINNINNNDNNDGNDGIVAHDEGRLNDIESRGKARSSFDYDNYLRQHQLRLRTIRFNKPLPIKTTLAAFVFLIGGIVFLIAGLVVYFGPDSGRGLPMIILGSIMFIPGSYSSFILFGAWKGWSGYEYNQVPSYDDD